MPPFCAVLPPAASCPPGWWQITTGVGPRHYADVDHPEIYLNATLLSNGKYGNSLDFGEYCAIREGGLLADVHGKVSCQATALAGSMRAVQVRPQQQSHASACRVLQVLCVLGGRPASAGCSYTWRGTAPDCRDACEPGETLVAKNL